MAFQIFQNDRICMTIVKSEIIIIRALIAQVEVVVFLVLVDVTASFELGDGVYLHNLASSPKAQIVTHGTFCFSSLLS